MSSAPLSNESPTTAGYTGCQDGTNYSPMSEMHDLFMPQQFYPAGRRFISMEELKAHFGREESTIRRCFETMRTMWDLHVGFIPAREGYGYEEPVPGFPLVTIAERQLYDLIQSIQPVAIYKDAAQYRKLRKLIKDACSKVTSAMGLTFEEVEEALSFHIVGFDAPAPVDPELLGSGSPGEPEVCADADREVPADGARRACWAERQGCGMIFAGQIGDRRAPRGDRRIPHGDRRIPHGDRRIPRGDRRIARGDRRFPRGGRRFPHGDGRATCTD